MSRTPKWWRQIDRMPRETQAWFRTLRWIMRDYKKHPDQWIPVGTIHFDEE